MLVKKVQPKELPRKLISELSFFYEVGLDEFVAITDREVETLYVNDKVPQKDIEGFLEVIMFPGCCVCEEENGKGKFLEYTYEEYGYHTCEVLLSAYKREIDKKERKKAKAAVAAIMHLIEKELYSEEPIVKINKHFLYEIGKAGRDLNKRMNDNSIDYDSLCEFYVGFFTGAGILQRELVNLEF